MSQRCVGTTEFILKKDEWEPRNTYVREMYGDQGTHVREM